jgi:predicted nucleic acid-binding protein
VAARRSVSVVDALLAATALVYGLVLVTRNTADIDGLGAAVLNPFTPVQP